MQNVMKALVAAVAVLAFAGCGGSNSSGTGTTNDQVSNSTPSNSTPSQGSPAADGTLTVAGLVLDEDGNPITAEAVFVPGLPATATDDTGKFSIAGVTAPYDLVVIRGASKTAFIYKGLTRSDPTVFMWTQADDQTRLADRSAKIAGAVSGGGLEMWPSFINFASKEINQWYDPDAQAGIMISGLGPLPQFYLDALEWNGPVTTVGNVLGLQFQPDLLSGLPVAYWTDYQPGMTVLAGQPLPLAGPHLFLRPAATETVQGAITTPGQYSVTNKFVGLQFSGGINFFVFADAFAPATRNFNYIVPDLAGATTQVCAQAADNLFWKAVSVTCDTVANQDGVLAISIREAPEPYVPANNGVGIDNSTMFQWTPFAGGIHVVTFKPAMRVADSMIESSEHFNPRFVVITAGTDTTIPDLSSVGLGLPSGADYGWVVRGTGPFASVDDFATYPVAVPPFNMAPVGTGNLTAPIPDAFWARSMKYWFSTK